MKRHSFVYRLAGLFVLGVVAWQASDLLVRLPLCWASPIYLFALLSMAGLCALLASGGFLLYRGELGGVWLVKMKTPGVATPGVGGC